MKEKQEIVKDDIVEPEIPQSPSFLECEICESKKDMFGLTVTIMDLQLQDLIFEKMYLLFQKLQPALKEQESAKIELQINKDKLLLETDFKTELGESRPTVAMKEAYMKPLLSEFEDNLDYYNDKVDFYKNKLTIINDLIKAQRLLLDIEGALIQ